MTGRVAMFILKVCHRLLEVGQTCFVRSELLQKFLESGNKNGCLLIICMYLKNLTNLIKQVFITL